MLIESFMPSFDFSARHETDVSAEPAQVYAALRSVNLVQSPISIVLLAARAVPMVIARRKLGPRLLTLNDLSDHGFVLLADEPEREIVLGLVGKFWRPDGGLLPVAADDFTSFDRPGYAKAAWNFALERRDGHTILSTETRVLCTDARSRTLFRAYWLLIRPFSSIIRAELLRLTKGAAERSSFTPAPG